MEIVRVAFDMDDTLLAEAPKRNQAALACTQVIINDLGWRAPHAEHLLTRQRICHKSLTQNLGHHPDQYIRSWLDMLIECGGQADSDAAMAVRLEALKAYQPPYELVPDAASALLELQGDSRFELYLVTIGDTAMQKFKVKHSLLKTFFSDERIHVVRQSKVEALRQIAGDQPERTAMVGNSVRSDMWPAAEAGVLPIWIPCGATSFYYEDYPNPHLDEWLNPSSISEVPAFLGQQFFSE